MISFDSSLLMFGIVCCWTVRSAAAAAAAAAIVGDDYESDLGTAKQLDGRLKAIPGSPWWSAAKYRENPATKDSKRSIFFEGLFNADHRRQTTRSKLSSPTDRRRRVSVRPRDAVTEITETTTTTTVGTAAAITGGGRPVFGGETECVSANKGRPCVCYTTDFLDSVSSLLDEMVVRDDVSAAVVGFACRSYRVVPPEFVVSPSSADATAAAETTTERLPEYTGADETADNNGTDTAAAPVPAGRKEVDFNYVVNYRLDKSKDEHVDVQYALLGSDVKIRCLPNKTGISTFEWDVKNDQHKTNSTITGADKSSLSILRLESGDSKNYTCQTTTAAVVGSKTTKNVYKHYVIAIDKPIYEIRGTAMYNTSGGCTQQIINPIRKQLPGFMRAVVCPEGSSQYACDVVVERTKCSEDKSTLEVNYLVTLNDKAGYLARLRTSKKGQNALFYQKLIAKITDVIVGNLNKTMLVQIVSKYSLNDTRFESDRDRMDVKKFVSCAPGFGIREVFCSACPPHHYSPGKSVECLKCSPGFHQPVAGSEKCVKCPNIFASGCYIREIPKRTYYALGSICLSICLIILLLFCVCYCCEENETTSRIIPKKMRKKFKRAKKYDMLLQSDQSSDDSKSSIGSSVRRKLKKMVRFDKKYIKRTAVPILPFVNVHQRYGERIPQK